MPKFTELYESIMSETTKPNYKEYTCLLVGSFKPPHKGHWDMVKYYANMCKNVNVIISSPNKKVRETSSGKIITPEISKKIFEIYKSKNNLSNVSIEISDEPSPVKLISDYIIETAPNGSKFILGVSEKDNLLRFSFFNKPDIIAKLKEKNIIVADPKNTAYPVSSDPISATDIRDNIEDLDKIKDKYFPSEVAKDNKTWKEIKRLLS